MKEAWAVATFLLLASAARAEPPLPGPGPRRPPASLPGLGAPSDEACARCHPAIGAEWRASLHRAAWLDTYVQRTRALDPSPAFCRRCHAPDADSDPPPTGGGIGCLSCHVSRAGVASARGRAPDPRAHGVISDPRLATAAACANCHSFEFPDGLREPMQTTVSEHAGSSFANEPCQGCHMPLVRGADGAVHRRHDFAVQGDPAMLRKAVSVASAKLTAGAVEIVLAPGRIGHAFPTGDLRRRVEVRAFALDGRGRPTGAPVVFALERSFAHDARRNGTRQIADTRLPAPGTRGFAGVMPVKLALRERGAARVRWQVVWQRMPAEIAGMLRTPMAGQEIVVAEGEVERPLTAGCADPEPAPSPARPASASQAP